MNIGDHMEAVARHLLGEPNKALSSKKELRYGERGSLKINLEDGVWHDFERDEKGGVFKLITRETGLQPKDIPVWLNEKLGIQLNGEGGQLIAIYPYLDEGGQLLYEVLRYDPKDFLQRRPNGVAGQYEWGLGKTRRVPFRLPELLKRSQSETVYIAEGEKDVLTLEAWGLLATTNSGGAGQWHDGFKKYLKNADVVIVPHNDDAGEARTAKILKSLQGFAKRIRVVKLPVPQKEDVTWWRQNGGTPEEFLRRCEDVGLPTPPAAESKRETSNAELWLDCGLNLDAKGQPLTNMNNCARLLEHDPLLKGTIWFDEFLQRIQTGNPAHEWGDADLHNLQRYIQSSIGIRRMSAEAIKAAVIQVAYLNPRNQVKDWFETLEWDGIERISHFFPDYFGTPETAYSTAVSRNFWLSMVARVYKPGCKVDNMVILEGKQGAGKSHALHIIGGEWYAEQNTNVRDHQKFAENIQGKVLIEIGEMDSFHNADMTRVKQTVTCTSDRYRDSYGVYSRDHPRRGIFAGTTNADDWNRDATGARRFWPIRCVGLIDLEGMERVRTQCFAEAVATFKAGAKWWVMPEIETEAEQRARYVEDAWDEKIDQYVASRSLVTTSEIIDAIGLNLGQRKKADMMTVGRRLTFLGWEKTFTRVGGILARAYKKGGDTV